MNGFVSDFKNTWNKPNNSLAKLIIINVAVWVAVLVVYFISQTTGNQAIYTVVFDNISIPRDISEFVFKPWTLLTYFFVHQDFFHILFNMLIMYWFGMLVQEFLGTTKLVALYLIGGLAGGLAYLLIFNLTPLFSQGGGSGMIGASASVYAIVVGAATLMPDYRMNLIFIGPVKIKYIAAVYIFLSFIGTAGSNAGGNVAHLGGALMGFIFIKQMQKGNDWSKPVNSVLEFFSGLFSRRPKMKVSYRKTAGARNGKSKGKADTPNQADVDAILDKISESGYETLSAEEKEILFKASQKNS